MRDALLAAVIRAAGTVNSRVKLQKMVYLLQRMGFDLGYRDFVLRDFGPYSAELASTVDFVSRNHLVRETPSHNKNDLGEAYVQYSYQTHERHNSVLAGLLQATFPVSANKLGGLAQQMAGQNTRALEVAATAVLLRDEMGIIDEDQLWAQVAQRKGHLKDRFPQAKKLLAKWDAAGLLTRQEPGPEA